VRLQPLLLDVPLDETMPQDPSFRLPTGERIEIPAHADPLVKGSATVQSTGDAGDYVVVPFRNVGGGLAAVVEIDLFVKSSEAQAATRVEQQYLASGEATRAIAVLPRRSPARSAFIECSRPLGQGIALGVAYTDLAGTNRGEVVFHLAREIGKGWHVVDVDHHVLPGPLRTS
jgi:hypothetical protein